MSEEKNILQNLIDRTDEKTVKKLRLNTFLNLVNKVEPLVDSQLHNMIDNLVNRIDLSTKEGMKEYSKGFNEIRIYVRKTHNMYPKGELQGSAIGMGAGIGVALGAAFMSINPGLMGAGIAIGVGIGVSIGGSKEKEAEKNGQIY